MRIQVTEYLDIDLEKEVWLCRQCEKELISARDNYKKGCLVYDRDPRDIHNPISNEPLAFCPDPNWVLYVEFYCPSCGTLLDVEPLPPGHPITHDIQLDIDGLKDRFIKEKEIKEALEGNR
ncbi:acetone carboxylase subunit gamma [Chloroflexota bacterium]